MKCIASKINPSHEYTKNISFFIFILVYFSAHKYKNGAGGFSYKSSWTLLELFPQAILVVNSVKNYNTESQFWLFWSSKVGHPQRMQNTWMFSKGNFVGKCRTTTKTIPNPMLLLSVFPEPAVLAGQPGPKVLALITFKFKLLIIRQCLQL